MPSKRAAGQKQVLTMMDERFLAEINRAMRRAGYSDRSSFIRDAVYEKLKRSGVVVEYDIAMAPARPKNFTIINGGRGHTVHHHSDTAKVAEDAGAAPPLPPSKRTKYAAKKKKGPKT